MEFSGSTQNVKKKGWNIKSTNQNENFSKKRTLKVKRSPKFVWRRNLQAQPKMLNKIVGTSNQPIKTKKFPKKVYL
jgi:hypothetical protein